MATGTPSEEKVNQVLAELRSLVAEDSPEEIIGGRKVARITFPVGVRSLEVYIPPRLGISTTELSRCLKLLVEVGLVEPAKRGISGYCRWVAVKDSFSAPTTSE